jgi:hypothetical protein
MIAPAPAFALFKIQEFSTAIDPLASALQAAPEKDVTNS